MVKINKGDIKLYDTITCGQIFRYSILDNKYTIILSDRVVTLYEDDKYIYIDASNEDDIENIIKDYLDLNRDYNEICNKLVKNDKLIEGIVNECAGFKIIHSYPFETIISYMISANNNVKNIQKSVNLLSEKYGKKVHFNDCDYYLFPNLNDIKNLSIDDLNELKLGFRSTYIHDFLNKITIEDINNISNMKTDDALNYLMSFKGIGIKIASCILLFGYSRFDVYPIDTWVKKYMSDTYNISDTKKIEEFAKEKYNEYSGLVIQYMFHSKRNKLH